MLGPLIRAQLTAMLTKVLVDSPLFNAGVRKFDGSIVRAQQAAYDALLKATQEHDDKFPTASSSSAEQARPSQRPAEEAPHRPKASETDAQRDEQLRKLIEKTKRDIHDWNKKS